jgi:uncharacterized membrane protein
MEETRARSIAKTLSWRVLATFITAAVAFAVTSDAKVAVAVGLADTLIKLVIYFMHERLWNRISYGRAASAS